MTADEQLPDGMECGWNCYKQPTHEVRPHNPDRSEWIPVCEFHADLLRPISSGVRKLGGEEL